MWTLVKHHLLIYIDNGVMNYTVATIAVQHVLGLTERYLWYDHEYIIYKTIYKSFTHITPGVHKYFKVLFRG